MPKFETPIEEYDVLLLDLWEEALKQELGLCVPTDNVEGLKRRLYAFRKKLRQDGDLRFASYQLTASPTDQNELWIVKEGGITHGRKPQSRVRSGDRIGRTDPGYDPTLEDKTKG